MLKKLIVFACIVSFCLAAALAGGIYWLVVLHPGEEIKLANIQSILGKESHVFYSDNHTPLGVFFDQAHRQYVEYVEIPPAFVNALVASEDNRFFSHFGFDILGIGRAAIKNIQAGRVVQGGSTLTQQTAKNLFDRTDRSIRSKVKELLFALRLEYHYSKEKIFEFYANQFYVSGNGHGLGVAAIYYFDKKPRDLSLVECAFIAGSVKRPNYYNPFIKKTDEAAGLAIERGEARLRYVLDKMFELGMISQTEYQEALGQKLDFNQGKVGYSLDYAMDLVKEAVTSTEVLEALEKHGVDNVATSGIRIVTTIDKDLQSKALHALRQGLSLLDIKLRGYEREQVQEEYRQLDYEGDGQVEPLAFLFGTITKITGQGKDIAIEVDLGRKLGKGIIDQQGLAKTVDALVKWQRNLWATAGAKDQNQLVARLLAGDKVWVSVRETGDFGEPIRLDLHKYPKVQGGALVLKDGLIQAMAGGVENRFYNRAVAAQRTMGSSFKPFVFTAAMQLGWNSADVLQNKRNVFVFRGQPYFPRPDHLSPHQAVSLSWAGVHSENLASVWLLAHLCDQLNADQFREVAEYVGLTPQRTNNQEETYEGYRARLRDTYGITINAEVLRAAAYRRALKNIEADFMFENMAEDYAVLRTLPYGLGFDRFTAELTSPRRDGGALTGEEQNELQLRKGLLANTFLSLAKLQSSFAQYRLSFAAATPSFDPEFAPVATGAGIYYDQAGDTYSYMWHGTALAPLQQVDQGSLRGRLALMSMAEQEAFWQRVRIGGKISGAGLDLLDRQLEAEYQQLTADRPYSFNVLAEVEDFRTLVGLRYCIELGKSMGVKSKLDTVLSFPLGSNVVTLLEATRIYESIVTGSTVLYGAVSNETETEALAMIDRIESEDGKILYQPERRTSKVVADKIQLEIGHILENVVKFGTGRQAGKQVRLPTAGQSDTTADIGSGMAIPLLGKTGTANNYTNASFFGYLPAMSDTSGGLTTKTGYAVGTYVGFDDNTSMRRGGLRITGAAGALPTWIDIVNSLVQSQQYASKIDPVDFSFSGLTIHRDPLGQINLAVDDDRGGRVAVPSRLVSEMALEQPSILTFGRQTDYGEVELTRIFAPFWKQEKQAE